MTADRGSPRMISRGSSSARVGCPANGIRRKWCHNGEGKPRPILIPATRLKSRFRSACPDAAKQKPDIQALAWADCRCHTSEADLTFASHLAANSASECQILSSTRKIYLLAVP